MSIAIKEVARRGKSVIDPKVKRYMERCVSPLVGPIRGLRVVNYDASNRALITVLPELVEVHRRAKVDRPDYHLGGFGFSLEEATMRALGESMERAAHFIFHVYNAKLLSQHSQYELEAIGTRHVPITEFGHFTPEQLQQPGCLVQAITAATRISWVPAINLQDGEEVLLPAQAILAGFSAPDEPRAFVGITTGSAAHLDYSHALLGALLEMLQVDVTVGHWYSCSTALRIDLSSRSTPRFAKFWERHSPWLDRANGWCEFYWLRQPEDLPIYVVACAIRRRDSFPALTIGHGVATDLEQAMYRALYESIPISLVVQFQTLQQMFGEPGQEGRMPRRRASDIRSLFGKLDIRKVTDLEAGVAYYAIPENAERLFPLRFNPHDVISGPDIYRTVAPVWKDEPTDHVCSLILAEATKHYRVFAMDLTTEDIAALGFRVVRVYSPDLMSLPLPSFPEAAHPRFETYGGFRAAEPHPYP